MVARALQRIPQSALYAIGAALGTALLQSDLKTLRSLGYGIESLLFLRYAGVFILSTGNLLFLVPAPAGARWGFAARFRPVKLSEQLLRGAFMLGTTVGVFLATMFLTVAQVGAISLATWPLLALLFARWFGESVARPGWVAASTVVALAGLGILLASTGVDSAPRFAVGAGLLCVASVCTALNQHFNRRANQRKEDMFVSMFYQSLLGFVATSLLWLTAIPPFAQIRVDLSMVRLDHAVWLGLVVLLAFFAQLWYFLVARAPVTASTPLAAVQAPFGAWLDNRRDGTVPAGMEWAGLAVLLFGVALSWPAVFAQAERRRQSAGGATPPPGAVR
jgi:drug/metabolite transporter (DMT)-like permease